MKDREIESNKKRASSVSIMIMVHKFVPVNKKFFYYVTGSSIS
jgi:hypothetical protein